MMRTKTVKTALSGVLLAVLAMQAGASLFVVDTTAVDVGDFDPGDGKCEWIPLVPEGQRCTLRAAVQEANAFAGADVILIPDGWHIVLSSAGQNEDSAATGDLDILESVTIGSLAQPEAWPVVNGNGIDRVFEVWGEATLTLGQIEIRGGSVPGGAIRVHSLARSELSSCRLMDNSANFAAAILNAGTSTVSHCAIERNRSFGASGSSAIDNALGGTLEIEYSTVAANFGVSSAIDHGGLSLTVVNSTIADNDNTGLDSSSDLVLRNVTIVGNHRLGLAVHQPGAFASPSIRNSIIAGNGLGAFGSADCSISIPGGVADIAHPNLDSDDTCGFLPAFGGLPNFDPMLGSLQLNGGTTRTMVPKVGSPVIDTGNNGTCQGDDQRGAARPLDGNETAGLDCDIGAVEVLPCVGTANRVVSNIFIGGFAIEYEACFTITVGPAMDIFAGGDVTFRARDSVSFTNGFSVHSGGKFEVILDPATGSGMTLP